MDDFEFMNRIMRPAVFVPIFLFHLITAQPVYAGDATVCLNILSKQIRLLKEGSLRQIQLVRGNDSVITDELSREKLRGDAIVILHDTGGWRALVGSRVLAAPFHIGISPIGGDGTCTIQLEKEARLYPLPISVRCDGDGLKMYARERLDRYAMDSALAEYGPEYRRDTEAVMALAHLIRARYAHRGGSSRHGDADFCDLTHCQVYRGRVAAGMLFNDRWAADSRHLPQTIVFHSRCGGFTLDARVFGDRESAAGQPEAGVRDWLYRDGSRLCAEGDAGWERSLGHDELCRILFEGRADPNGADVSVSYETSMRRVYVRAGRSSQSYPVETFRLKLNRVKGWNFIRSNGFTVADAVVDGRKVFVFRGRGLGHGVGLCQHGAIALSRRGYNRFEICEHYYPDMQWSADEPDAISPYLSYAVFDIHSGKILGSSHGQDFNHRTIPPGSVFKLIVSLYLASERPDIFNDYSYDCTAGENHDPAMPERCWNPKGHGPVRIQRALSNSCNLYFASLYDRISEKRFRDFFIRFCRHLGIDAVLPDISGREQWSKLLAGLDFRFAFTIDDYIRLARYIHSGRPPDNETAGFSIPERERIAILASLKETFTTGTASGRFLPAGPTCNYSGLGGLVSRESFLKKDGMWGKTATVIDGTNKPMSYGLFVGGRGGSGIVAVLRKGNGRMTAHWAEAVLSRFAGD